MSEVKDLDFDKSSQDVSEMIADALVRFAVEIRNDPKKIYDSEWSWDEVQGRKSLTVESLDIRFK
ncbi:TPA: hypothetical protein ACSW15_005026 [Enterobacter hormaechei]|uniref:hypothetical protein n=1 Tax=Enterobacter cloacae complex TaxID=354276 RepID=UPI00064ADC1A|nr:hypothetical protein [Enterobacter hormaechei]EJB8197418.1 hypothetical protein [Enterobacter hormaechei]EKU5343712.1 hypothetical protein [Enterobacter hormaechei]EKU5348530.1 hypothetical protein [Enterobacter hormaechei]EKU5425047.1 hypothetical protein [Enterobacter hormaechei]EKX8243785.1 hypothetical protein [Enterobacter hormaechei]